MITFFQNIPGVLAVMSECDDGSMKLFKGSDLNVENRKRFFQKNGIRECKIIAAEIVHGARMEIVDTSSVEFVSEVDGLITKEKEVFLSVTVADCIPVYLYESKQKIIGVLHCGWRGIVAGIVPDAIEKISGMGGRVEDLKIALGPGINECHFEVQEDVLDMFGDFLEYIIRQDGRIFIDLKGIIKKQLVGCKIHPENIEDNNACTMESKRYFSYRRDKPKVTEAMVAVIGMSESCSQFFS